MTAIELLEMMSNDEGDSATFEFGSASNPEQRTSVKLARSKQKAVNPVTYSSERLPNGKLAGYVRLSEFNSEGWWYRKRYI